MGKIKQLMIGIEELAMDHISDMDAEIYDRIEEMKDEYREFFIAAVNDFADGEGWSADDLETILEMSLEDIFDEAMFSDSEYA